MRHIKYLSIILLSLCAVAGQAQIVEKPAKTSNDVITLRVENDIYFSDRYYTNGLKLSYTGEGDDFWTSRLQFAALKLFVPEGRQVYQTVSVGQKMCVSSDINIPNPPLDDRPYAGWLYMGFGSHLASENRLDSFTVNLGVVGPMSLAEDAQKFFHSIIGADWPRGWHNQIKNEPGIILAYEHTERFYRAKITDDFSADILGSAGIELGNVMTQATARGFLRFGYNLPYSFQPNRIDSADGNDVEWRPTDASPDWHCFMYGGGAARFVGYDITLDGNTYRNSRSVVPKWLVGEAMAGISTRYKFVQADLNWTLRSAEFNTQKYPVHMFWTLAVKVFF
jgi:hypothetical protein